MWLGDAALYLIKEAGRRAFVLPCTLLAMAWVLWFRGQRSVRPVRNAAFVVALTSGTIAAGIEVALLLWWSVIHPLLYERPPSCGVVSHDVSFLAAAISVLLSAAGDGLVRGLALLAGTCLLVLILLGIS